ncbi:phosphorylase [Mangrovimonas yunxiaonensis]|uniref:Uridine phosphorylase n=1 Tax=Mangrovimonas yunxiaonensis TaxID=1197477 RepID=A0A084THF6_9FLAO|nr:nucleoside phosphorylase [Mangrovimonas yunxiaonensis]KFB00142.1 phosphorylase [Mangrovimonas yunxiaonensis]GGH42117.1 phosphorylase [Mangrovimonas yunxiaonensis]
MAIKASELIINPDGSIYHLNLRPEHIAPTVITVGDPDRVDVVTKYFDTIEFKTRKREFHTQTGTLNGKRLSVVSTGIGTDNIDIVLNELDALVNINFETREVNPSPTSLDIVRIGTSGSIQADIPVDSFLLSEYAVGFDSLLHFYKSDHVLDVSISEALVKHLNWHKSKSTPYVVSGSSALLDRLTSKKTHIGFTATNVGFYGPQGRVLRLAVQDSELNDKLASFNHQGLKVTNMEMETAGIYGLAALLGHKALSLNAIIANRPLGEFSKYPKKITEALIRYTLEKLTQ